MPDSLVPSVAEPAAHSLPAFGYSGEAASNPIERPVAAVRRYKWLILGIVVASTALGFLATRFITPSYQVRATVWIESGAGAANDRVGPIRSSELLASSTAWVELFRSYRIVDEVGRKLSLYLQPEIVTDRPLFAGFALGERYLPGSYELLIQAKSRRWTLRSAAGIEVDRGEASDSIGRKAGFLWQLPASAFQSTGDRKVNFTVVTPRETSQLLLSRLDHRLSLGSNFLWLSYQDPNADLAARTLNTWLQEYVQVAAELKRRNMVEFTSILEGQLRFAEKATSDAESAYQRFRVSTITLPTEGGPVAAGVEATRDPALTSFFDQKIQYDNLRQDREALEKSLANAMAGRAPYEGLLLIPSVAQSPGAEGLRDAFHSLMEKQAKLRAERQSFTEEFASVKDLRSSIDMLQNQTIPQLATQLLTQLRDREMDYKRRIEGASKELQKIPPRTIEEMRLHRAVVVAEGLYTNLKNRYSEAKLAEASASPDVSVLDTAIAPLSPTKNKQMIVLLGGFMGGLAAAIALALLLDRVDTRFRYTGQAETELGLVVAGAVPKVPKRGINASSAEEVVQFVESFRTLRMHVMHSVTGKRIQLAIASAAPSDGKSLVASNLALSFAEAGLRTVLIDADTRRGALHKSFSVPGKDGLTEYLAGALTAEQLARPTSHANLFLVSCGRRHSRSPELLMSSRLKELVDQLSRTFDVVLLDTPPFSAGIDAYAIAAAASRILMVVRMGQTKRRLAAVKLGIVSRLPIDVLGVVLNSVQLQGEFQYYAYSKGYHVGMEESAIAEIASSGSR